MAETLSLDEFIEKYRRLCGHIAWTFVRRSHREISPIVLTQEDAEDFASCALVKLMKCPEDKRDQKPYVNLLIVNAIITAWRKRLKQMDQERDGSVFTKLRHDSMDDGDNAVGRQLHAQVQADPFDTLEGRDGVHTSTALKFDSAKVSKIMPSLPHAERLVIELNFGLGCPPCGTERIGKKLGRSKDWVSARITRGIGRIREQLTVQQQIPTV